MPGKSPTERERWNLRVRETGINKQDREADQRERNVVRREEKNTRMLPPGVLKTTGSGGALSLNRSAPPYDQYTVLSVEASGSRCLQS